MIRISIIGPALHQLVPEPEMELELDGPMTVKGLMEAYPSQLGSLSPLLQNAGLLITVNRKIGTADTIVKDGDAIKFTHQAVFSYDGARWHNP
jgi:molybdopterin synthase sulfur carrier subunit